jgi:hypothetical protein
MASCSGLGCRELSNGTRAAGRRIERPGPTAREKRGRCDTNLRKS